MYFQQLLRLKFFVILICTFLTFSIRANIVILNGLTHENTSPRGAKYRETIHIQNTGTAERSVRVYIRDYWYSYTGESRHDEPGTMHRSNADWISISPKLLTLAPSQKAVVDFEVATPNIDSLVGTYWSVLMVEGLTPQDTVASTGVKIHTAIRYAIQVITNIENTGIRDLQFVGLELQDTEGERLLNVAIQNTGERILKPELSLEIFSDSGESFGVFKTDKRKTLPDTSILLSIELVGIKPGSYAAVLIADCEEDHIFGTNITLEI